MEIMNSQDNRRILRIGCSTLVGLAFILFFHAEVIYSILKPILSFLALPDSIRGNLTAVIIYTPLIIAIAIYKIRIPLDAIVLFSCIYVYFFITFLVHPEYEYVLTRSIDGAWDKVLRPDQGLYAYLFIRLVKDIRKTEKYFKIIAFSRLFFHFCEFVILRRQGYVLVRKVTGDFVQRKYSLALGYELLVPTLIFLYYALKQGRKLYFGCFLFGLVMITIIGSRGPFFCIAILLIIYVLKNVKINRRYGILIALILITFTLIYIFYDRLLIFLISIMKKYNISLRTVEMVLNGNIITELSGRDKLWENALRYIRENPIWGYGFLGDRHFQYTIHYSGYSHDIFIEMIVDFGVIIGALLFTWLIISAIKMIIVCNDGEFFAMFLIFMSISCKLITSNTFWSTPQFWGAIAICVNYNIVKSMSKKMDLFSSIDCYSHQRKYMSALATTHKSIL
jgi:O-antigen ligase